MTGKFEYEYEKGFTFTCDWCFTSKISCMDYLGDTSYSTEITFSITYTPKNRKKAKKIKHDDLESLQKFFDLFMNLRNFFYTMLSKKVSDCIYELVDKKHEIVKQHISLP